MKPHRKVRGLSVVVLAIVFVAGVGTSAALFYGPSFLEREDRNTKNSMIPIQDSASESETSVVESVKSDSLPANPSQTKFRELDEIANLNSPLERSTALLNVLSEANKDQVLELLEQSKQLDPLVRVQTQAVILQKLVRVNASNALTQVVKFNQLGSSDMWSALFSEWAQIDLNEAMSYASTLDNTERQTALAGILQERIDLTDQKRLEIARQLDTEQYAINMITLEKLTKSIAEPEEVWKEIVEEAQNDGNQIELLTQVAQIWVEKQGLDALDQIFATLDNSQTRSQISIAVFREIAHTNPSAAYEYCITLDKVPLRDSLLIVVEEWVMSDPQGAFDAIVSIAGVPSHRGRFRILVETFATYNPRSILEQLDSLPNDMVELATKTAVSALASNSPADAVAMVLTVEDEMLKGTIVRSVIDHWTARDMDAALDWVLQDPSLEFQRTRLLGYVLGTLVEYDPEHAMRVALAHSIVENELGPEQLVIAQLVQTDVDKVIEFLPKVREGVTKTRVYLDLGWELVRRGMTDKALQLLQEIPQYAEKPYLNQILSTWQDTDPTSLFESLDQLPSAEVTSAAALILLLNDPWGEHLNAEQMAAARGRLTEEHTMQLKRQSLKALETRRRSR